MSELAQLRVILSASPAGRSAWARLHAKLIGQQSPAEIAREIGVPLAEVAAYRAAAMASAHAEISAELRPSARARRRLRS